MKLHYAERIEDCRIADRGIFWSASEFIPYRLYGWSGTDEFDQETDNLIEKMKVEICRYIFNRTRGKK